jgi:ATP-dependent helicase HrpA
VQRLPIEKISRAAADQRKGRCGRVSEGVCLRLYSSEDFETRSEFTDPEIRRTSLAAVILQLKCLQLGEVEDFPFIDPPDHRYINDGYKLLQELGALDGSRSLTPVGRQLARFPVEPRIARMLLGGKDENSLTEVLIIASALSIQDPRERPIDARDKADEAHDRFKDPQSDFLWYLNLWRFYQEQSRHLSKNKLRRLCCGHFLSYMRMREWCDIHSQLRGLVHDMGFATNEEPAGYEAIHRALLTGLLGNIGFQTDRGEFTGPRGVKFGLFPGSALFKKQPRWVVAAELAETTRLYARTVAKVEAEWIIEAARHLVKRSYSEPHWERRLGRAVAYEKVTLYGLTLSAQRKVNYVPIDPVESRRLFIRSALVEGDLRTKAAFFKHNMDLIQEIRELEHRTRRFGILADEQTIFDFYDKRISAKVHCAHTFERWRKEVEQDNARLLFLDRDVLVRESADQVSEVSFPQHLTLAGIRLDLSYRFEPGHQADGVSVLNQLETQCFEWLVPGLLHEKIAALIRGLPKPLRKNFVPAPDFARACSAALCERKGSLLDDITEQLKRMTGVDVPRNSWRTEGLPAHLLMNFRVVDHNGHLVVQGRSLESLKAHLRDQIYASFRDSVPWDIERVNIVRWDFGSLPQVVESRANGVLVKGFPALVDKGDSVSIEVFDTAAEAMCYSRSGMRRLFMLELPQQMQYMKKNLPNLNAMCRHFASIGRREELEADLVSAIVDRAFLSDVTEVRRQDEFYRRRDQGRAELMTIANGICQDVSVILERFHEIQQRISGPVPAAWLRAVADLRDQLQELVYRGFVTSTPPERLAHIPRFLCAINLRLDKLERDPARDKKKAAQIAPFWQAWKQYRKPRALDPEAIRYRWMVEEFRVSLFAQELGTSVPVSQERLRKQWRRITTSKTQ